MMLYMDIRIYCLMNMWSILDNFAKVLLPRNVLGRLRPRASFHRSAEEKVNIRLQEHEVDPWQGVWHTSEASFVCHNSFLNLPENETRT